MSRFTQPKLYQSLCALCLMCRSRIICSNPRGPNWPFPSLPQAPKGPRSHPYHPLQFWPWNSLSPPTYMCSLPELVFCSVLEEGKECVFLLCILIFSVLFPGCFLFTCCSWTIPAANIKRKRNAADYIGRQEWEYERGLLV